MGENGQVIDKKDGFVIVRLKRQEACSKCRACIAGLSEQEMLIQAKNVCSADIDDWVSIELQSRSFLKAVSIMYGIPFVLFFSGLLAGYYAASVFMQNYRDMVGFFTGLFCMIFAFYLISRKEKDFQKGNYIPVAVQIIKSLNGTKNSFRL